MADDLSNDRVYTLSGKRSRASIRISAASQRACIYTHLALFVFSYTMLILNANDLCYGCEFVLLTTVVWAPVFPFVSLMTFVRNQDAPSAIGLLASVIISLGYLPPLMRAVQ